MSEMVSVVEYFQMLAVAVLVGKVVLLSFIVAPILTKNLEREPFGKVVRQLFPAYYTLGMGTAIVGLVSVIGLGLIRGITTGLLVGGGTWLIILVAEAYCRSPLTPQSNAMRDRLTVRARNQRELSIRPCRPHGIDCINGQCI